MLAILRAAGYAVTMPRLILVSNRLPVRVDEHGRAIRTTGGLASALEGADLGVETLSNFTRK